MKNLVNKKLITFGLLSALLLSYTVQASDMADELSGKTKRKAFLTENGSGKLKARRLTIRDVQVEMSGQMAAMQQQILRLQETVARMSANQRAANVSSDFAISLNNIEEDADAVKGNLPVRIEASALEERKRKHNEDTRRQGRVKKRSRQSVDSNDNSVNLTNEQNNGTNEVVNLAGQDDLEPVLQQAQLTQKAKEAENRYISIINDEEVDPSTRANARLNLGYLIRSKNPEEAKSLFRDVINDEKALPSTKARAHAGLGALIRNNNPEEAENLFRDVINVEKALLSTRARARVGLGRLIKRNRPEEAAQFFQELIDDGQVPLQKKAESMFELGKLITQEKLPHRKVADGVILLIRAHRYPGADERLTKYVRRYLNWFKLS